MRLMAVTVCTPIRNEHQEIYKWEEREKLISPTNIEFADYHHEIKHVVIGLVSGTQFPIKESLFELNQLYEKATSGGPLYA